MAGASTPEMVLAAGAVGALGSFGSALQTSEQIRRDVETVRSQSTAPINLNFFTHTNPDPSKPVNPAVMTLLAEFYAQLDAGDLVTPHEATKPCGDEMCELVRALDPAVASFHFGLPDAKYISALKAQGIVILSSATSVAEAVWLEKHGADAIIAQGFEAGGHNGWFLDRDASDVATTMALVPRIVDAVGVPVIAAGGISDGRGIAAAMMLGAQGVQIGTALLASPECALPDVHKQAVLNASGDETRHTPAFSGRDARSLVNDYVRQSQDIHDWPDFPMMNAATAPLRKASAVQGMPDAVSLWAGQGAGLVTQPLGVQQMIERMVAQADTLLS